MNSTFFLLFWMWLLGNKNYMIPFIFLLNSVLGISLHQIPPVLICNSIIVKLTLEMMSALWNLASLLA